MDGAHHGKVTRWCAEVLSVHRMGQRPRTHASREHWRYFMSLVLRLRVSNNISSTLFPICSPSVIVYHPPRKPWLGHMANAIALKAFASVQVLLLLVWVGSGPNPPYMTSTAADGICLLQRGGGPFVYLSMGWNDRAKLLERAQL